MVTKAPPAPKHARNANRNAVSPRSDHPTPADPPPSAPTVNQADEVMGELIEVDLENIQPSPDNPREYFDVDELRELADSIAGLGLLQPLLVGRCGGIFELIAGERRWRACQIANKKKAACYVRDMTPEEVTLARWEENKKRSDLSVIEEARSYQKAIERHGWTQQQLGHKLGISASEVSNRMRLLKLPEDWQKRIISREMHKRQGLDLIQFVGLPTFFKALEEKWAEYQEDAEHSETVSQICELPAAHWDAIVSGAIYSSSKGISDSFEAEKYYYPYFDLSSESDEVKADLECRDVVFNCEKTTRCWNVKLWTQIASDRYKANKAKQEKKNAKKDTADTKPEKKKELTAAEKKKLEEQHNKRIYRHRISWLQKQISIRAEGLLQEDFLVLFIGFAVMNGGSRRERLRNAVKSVGLQLHKGDGDSVVWPWVLQLDRGKLHKILVNYVCQWCQLEAKSWSSDANPSAIESLAVGLAIDLSLWRVTEDFLKLHTVDQLLKLMAEWKLLNTSNGTKADLIKVILSSDSNKKLPPPNELVKVSPCILD